jgi:hypothetical protein
MFDGTTLIIENPKGDRLEVEQEANSHLYYLKASPIPPRGEIFSADTGSNTNHKKSIGYVIVDKGLNKKTCEACAYANAKAKGVRMQDLPIKKAQEKGERLFSAPVSKLQRELAKLNTSYNQTSVVPPAEEEKENEEEIVFENEEDHDIEEDSV